MKRKLLLAAVMGILLFLNGNELKHIAAADGSSTIERYVGEIRLFPYRDFRIIEDGWEELNGKQKVQEFNPDLYSVIGTAFGGDDFSFSLPDLRGANPLPNINYMISVKGSLPGSADIKSHAGMMLYPGILNNEFMEANGNGRTPDLRNASPFPGINYYYSDNPNDSNVYIGEIRLFKKEDMKDTTGWLRCDGAELKIAEHKALFSLIGNRFGERNGQYMNIPNLIDAEPSADVSYYISINGKFPGAK
ncbi:phage tail protein [Cytobacillus praedii]|uniref:phage tail protein n=1 Tax=Cytobacillus praedii TaxID=1742358 RepID=UPI0013F46BFE|nr:phage tail protein [Cytobacillus praedii]